MTTTIAKRNREIKRALEQAFGRGKVTVRGSRGTGYGWVSVRIAYAPRDRQQSQELNSKAQQLACAAAKAAGSSIGTYGCGDPGSDYGYGRQINISFEQPRSSEWRAYA